MITKKNIFTLFLVSIFVVFVIAAFIGYHKIKAKFMNVSALGNKPIAVNTLNPHRGTLSQQTSSLAELKSIASVQVKAEVAGKIIKLTKYEGDKVHKGEIIAEIDPREQNAQLKSAHSQTKAATRQVTAMNASIQALKGQIPALETNLNFQKKQLKRDSKLLKSGAISSTQFEKTQNLYAEAKSRLSSLKAQIEGLKAQKAALIAKREAANQSVKLWQVRNDYSVIKSNVDGVVSARLLEVGDYARPGTPVYVIESNSGKKLSIQIPQDKTVYMKIGLKVIPDGSTINVDMPEFTINRIYPKLNRLNQMTVEAITDGNLPELPVGIQIPVKIITKSASGIIVPSSSVFNRSGNRFCVYQVKDGKALQKCMKAELIDYLGNAVVPESKLDISTPVVSASYLTDKRLPASFSVEVN